MGRYKMRKYRAPGDPTERDDALEMLWSGDYRKSDLGQAVSDIPLHPDFYLKEAEADAVKAMRSNGWPDDAIEASKQDPNGDYWQAVSDTVVYLVEHGGWVFDVDA